jgi:hypothetical protein
VFRVTCYLAVWQTADHIPLLAISNRTLDSFGVDGRQSLVDGQMQAVKIMGSVMTLAQVAQLFATLERQNAPRKLLGVEGDG